MSQRDVLFARFFAALVIAAIGLKGTLAHALRPVGLEESGAKIELSAGLEEPKTY